MTDGRKHTHAVERLRQTRRKLRAAITHEQSSMRPDSLRLQELKRARLRMKDRLRGLTARGTFRPDGMTA